MGCFLFLYGMIEVLNPCKTNGCPLSWLSDKKQEEVGGSVQEPMAPQESGGCFAAFRYSCKNPSLQSETVHYKRGVSQQFSLPSFKIDFSEWKDDEVTGGAPTFSYSFFGFSVFCLVHYTGCQGDSSWPWQPGNDQVFVLGQICRGTKE